MVCIPSNPLSQHPTWQPSKHLLVFANTDNKFWSLTPREEAKAAKPSALTGTCLCRVLGNRVWYGRVSFGHGQPGGCMCWWQLNKRLTLCHVERAISERSTGEAAFQHSSYGLTHQLHLHTYSNANVTSPKLTLFSCFTFLDFCFHCSFFSFLFFFTSYSLTNLQHKRPFGLTPTGYCPCGPCVLSDQVTNRDHIISQQGLVSTC